MSGTRPLRLVAAGGAWWALIRLRRERRVPRTSWRRGGLTSSAPERRVPLDLRLIDHDVRQPFDRNVVQFVMVAYPVLFSVRHDIPQHQAEESAGSPFAPLTRILVQRLEHRTGPVRSRYPARRDNPVLDASLRKPLLDGVVHAPVQFSSDCILLRRRETMPADVVRRSVSSGNTREEAAEITVSEVQRHRSLPLIASVIALRHPFPAFRCEEHGRVPVFRFFHELAVLGLEHEVRSGRVELPRWIGPREGC